MKEQLHNIRHSLAHLLAAAILELYPDTKNTIGPAIDDGFYYDFEFSSPISDKDLPKIEKKMKEILKTWKGFEGVKKNGFEAKEVFKNNEYKIELIEEIVNKGDQITFYTAGNFTDLCRGGHVEDTKEINPDSFKLDRIAGAYWRGDEKNKMLTRIYGLAFETKEELEAYITQREEAKKRDHKVIGPQMKLFTISPLVGPGLPLMQPKGMVIRKEIEDYLWKLHSKKGYLRVWTPHIAKLALYETSGHAVKFGDELFKVQGKEDSFILKPMNCPHHMQIFADNQFSYRNMPIRYFEPATVYRDEKSGQLGGLTRVRSITQDDGHLFCTSDQIGDEIKTIVGIIKEFYTTMGLIDGYWVRLSLRGDDKTKYLGSDDVWVKAESALTKVCIEENLPYKPAKDEAAFYGPKLDFMFKDAIGREWQLATIQCDFNLPERFDLSFVNNEGKKERPVVIHRAISGSLERFMGVMIEHTAGNFPLWLSPAQVTIIPISAENHGNYAKTVFDLFQNSDIRVELDDSNESLGKRIRNAKTNKTPYVIVIGDKEKDANTLTIEKRDNTKIENISPEEFLNQTLEKINSKSLEL
ncbi:MAG: threonine--tRNA ligase [Candidatus Nomurabacteria bacterium]|nr:threonine--tRNA ligase [Candidatus Nomurabacteria bacterium]